MAKKGKTDSFHVYSTTVSPPGGFMAALDRDPETCVRAALPPHQMGPGLTRAEMEMTWDQVRKRAEKGDRR